MKDINGNEFKVGCVFGIVGDNYEREVVKITDEGLYFINVEGGWLSSEWHGKELLEDKARILHYRELAPDKHGKMICEEDRVKTSFKERTVYGIIGETFLLDWDKGSDRFYTEKANICTFVSRPTDVPNEAAKKKAELQEQISKLEADKDKLAKDIAEMRMKADNM